MDWLDLLAVQGTIDFCVSTNSLDYCRFSVNFEVRKCQSLTFISHFFWLFSVPFISISILGTASQFLKRKIKDGIFIGFAWNCRSTWRVFSILKCCVFQHKNLGCLLSFDNISIFQHTSLVINYFAIFVPDNFILFDAIVNKIFSISFLVVHC